MFFLLACAQPEGKPTSDPDTGSDSATLPDTADSADDTPPDDTAPETGETDPCAGASWPGPWGEVSIDASDAEYGDESSGQAHVVALGDLDGDRHAEILVGVGDVRWAGTRAGAQYVFDGGCATGEFVDDDARIARTGADGESAGYAAAVADLDGDGVADLVTSAMGDATNGEAAGTVHVEHAPADGSASVSSMDTVLHGERGSAYLGYALATGDADGDGVAELLVGSPGASEAVLFDDPQGDAPVATASLRGGSWFGNAVAMGDANGDGVADILVGSSIDDDAGYQAGAAYVWYGPVTGTVDAGDADGELDGTASEAWAGSWVSMGDLDDDGRAELLVSAPGASVNTAYVLDGWVSGVERLDEAAVTITTASITAEVGSGFAVGDFDGDHHPDLAVGAHRYSDDHTGAAFVFPGPLSGAYYAADADGIIEGNDFSSGIGLGLAAGDVDGDGFDDLLVGGYTSARLFYGAPRP